MSNKASDETRELQLEKQAAFNLKLNDMDRTGAVSLAMGLSHFLHATDETETAIFLQEDPNLPLAVDAHLNYEIAKNLANANWFFLSSNIIFYTTASERLLQIKALLDPNLLSNQMRLRGREMVVKGNMFKILGFLLAAEGLETIAEASLIEQQEAPPP